MTFEPPGGGGGGDVVSLAVSQRALECSDDRRARRRRWLKLISRVGGSGGRRKRLEVLAVQLVGSDASGADPPTRADLVQLFGAAGIGLINWQQRQSGDVMQNLQQNGANSNSLERLDDDDARA